jgi:hypothetical protein
MVAILSISPAASTELNMRSSWPLAIPLWHAAAECTRQQQTAAIRCKHLLDMHTAATTAAAAMCKDAGTASYSRLALGADPLVCDCVILGGKRRRAQAHGIDVDCNCDCVLIAAEMNTLRLASCI